MPIWKSVPYCYRNNEQGAFCNDMNFVCARKCDRGDRATISFKTQLTLLYIAARYRPSRGWGAGREGASLLQICWGGRCRLDCRGRYAVVAIMSTHCHWSGHRTTRVLSSKSNFRVWTAWTNLEQLGVSSKSNP